MMDLKGRGHKWKVNASSQVAGQRRGLGGQHKFSLTRVGVDIYVYLYIWAPTLVSTLVNTLTLVNRFE